MRYGVTPTNLTEWVGLKVVRVPVPLPVADTILGPVQSRALIVAERTGALRKLSRGPATVKTLAEHLALDPECLRLVLRVLRGMGYVSLRGERWSLTRAAKRWFGERAKEPYEAYVQYGPPQWRMIERLDDVVRSGAGIDFHDHQSPKDWETYQEAMFENARASSWFLVKHVPVPRGARRLLDIAGAHGWMGAALAKKHRGLRVTVLDRPEALASARGIARANGYADVVTFEEGDLRKDGFGEGRDVVLLSNILHHFGADENAAILKRVHSAMKPGATVAVFEIETPADDAPANAVGDAFALYFRITSTSTCFHAADYERWLTGAGFSNVRVVRSLRLPSRMLIVARA